MRHVLITAGTKGLGKKMTEELLQAGYSVSVNYRSDEQAMLARKEEWKQYADRLQFVQGDVQRKEDLVNFVEQAVVKFGRVDALLLNAGPYIFERKAVADYEDEEWHEMINGNLNAAFYLLKEIVPLMRNQQFGRIITYGFQGADHSPGWLCRAAFAASKAGLASLTKSVAIEEASNGITANMVCPGEILGDMKESSIEEARKTGDEKTPVGRSGTGEDIARTVLFLLDEKADMVTGSVIEVTGGLDVLHKHRS
ncbi:SDR family oxidoreductase [Alkalicoccus daliensis]|uniref:3-oxoacyl-[acyl-carrier protein] reductase n=1 Tax=Alkalicoccus daliensis TaxID=745820 RepID=A0A1H0CBQ1_9BACI|nr:SDR family oxidoreductase [Alkalicoccus daliensis]SDN55295.1 3-oxoacyl-[acyl-carrier protein] reductase [Alkalicoccus daliensis]